MELGQKASACQEAGVWKTRRRGCSCQGWADKSTYPNPCPRILELVVHSFHKGPWRLHVRWGLAFPSIGDAPGISSLLNSLPYYLTCTLQATAQPGPWPAPIWVCGNKENEERTPRTRMGWLCPFSSLPLGISRVGVAG